MANSRSKSSIYRRCGYALAWQRQRDGGSHRRLARDLKGSAMAQHERPGDGQTQSGSGVVAYACGHDLREWFQRVGDLFVRHADAGVSDLDDDGPVALFCPDEDGAAFLRERDGVGKYV